MTEDLKIKIEVEGKQARVALDNLDRSLDQISKSLKQVDSQNFAKLSSNLDRIKNVAASSLAQFNQLSQAFNSIVSVVGSVVDVVKESVLTFAEEEKAVVALNSALQQSAFEFDPERIKAFNKQLSLSTSIAEDDIRAYYQRGMVLGLTQDRTEQLVRTTLDLAAATGKDANASFEALSNTLKGEVRGVAVYARELQTLEKEQVKAGAAIDLLGIKYAGFATSQSQTIEAFIARFNTARGEFTEALGGMISAFFGLSAKGGALDVTTRLINYLTESIENMTPIVAMISEYIARFAKTIADVFIVEISRGQTKLVEFGLAFQQLKGVFTENGDEIARYKNRIVELKSINQQAIDSVKTFAASNDDSNQSVRKVDDNVKKFKETLNQLASQTSTPIELDTSKIQKELSDILKKNAELEASLLSVGNATLDKLVSEQKALEAKKLELATQKMLTREIQDALDIQSELLAKVAQKDALTPMIDATKKLNSDNEKSSLRQRDLIKLNTMEELKKLDILEDQLKAKGLLNDESRSTISASRQSLRAAEAIQLDANPASIEAMNAFSSSVSNVGIYVAAAQAAVDAVPNLLNSIADLLNSIERLPMAIADSFARVIDGVLSLLTNFPSVFIRAIGSIKDSIIKLIKELPAAMQSFVLMIPDMILSVVDAIPDIVTALISSFISGFPKTIINAFKLVFIQLPKLIMGILTAVFVDLPQAIYDGFKQAFKEIKSIFLGGDLIDTNKAQESLKAYATSFAKSASSVFEVTDLSIANKNADSVSQQVLNAANKAQGLLIRAWNWVIDNVWNPLKNVVMTAFMWVIDNILSPMYRVVSSAFQWVIDNILAPLGNIVMTAFRWVVDHVLSPIYDIVVAPFVWVYDHVLSPIAAIVMDAFSWVYDHVLKPVFDIVVAPFVWVIDNILSPLYNIVKAPFQWVYDNVIKPMATMFSDLASSITKPFEDIYNKYLKPFIDGLKLPSPTKVIDSAVSAGSSVLSSIGSFLGFSDGGYVPGVSMMPGDNGSNDKIAAMLSPGEAVISREMLDRPGVRSLVNSILSNSPMQFRESGGLVGTSLPRLVPNLGSNPSQAQSISMPITINNYSNNSMDTSFVRDKILPEIRRELKQASLSGQYVISSKGVY